MLMEIGFVGLCLLFGCLVMVLFFCSIELAPIVARKTAKAARFSELNNGYKSVRFW